MKDIFTGIDMKDTFKVTVTLEIFNKSLVKKGKK